MSAVVLKLTKPAVPANPPSGVTAEELRDEIEHAWQRFQEAAERGDKDFLRELHLEAKAEERMLNVPLLLKAFVRHKSFFKAGYLIRPEKISPTLILIDSNSREDALYKIARAYWSMPYSKGYGRRLRYLVFDEYHESVMGIIGLQSPPADLACRDKLLQFPKENKLHLVNATLDAYTIGAIPPYSNLLAGKLVAGLISTDQVRQDYWRLYAGRLTQMQKKLLPQPLHAVTTTSAFGRSSIYNRLRYNDRVLAEPIGYTKGFGTVHLEAVYPKIAAWMRERGEYRNGGYGVGPKIRWQNICNAFARLELPGRYLSHGLKREVFLFRHIRNLEDVCARGALAQPWEFPTSEWAEYWLNRWAIPRALRDDSWLDVNTEALIEAGIRQLQRV